MIAIHKISERERERERERENKKKKDRKQKVTGIHSEGEEIQKRIPGNE